MAMYSVPLLGPVSASSSAGPDVYVAECRHVHEHDAEPFCSMAVLVSLSDDPVDRMALWPLRDALAFARCTTIGGVEWPKRLSEHIAALRPEFATAVIHVGSDGNMVAEIVQTVIDTLRQLLGAALALVVVVSDTNESLASLDGVNGFVRGIRSTNGETARQVFLALSSLHAPATWSGIDLLDLLPVLGPANAPTVLAEALWFREGEGSLAFLFSADRHAAQSSEHTVFVPLFCDDNLGDMRRFYRAVRECIPKSATAIFFTTNKALMPGLHPASLGLVPILCAPLTAAS